MGMDARAYLFYGFIVEEGENFTIPDEWGGDWEEYYNNKFNSYLGKWSRYFTDEQAREYWKNQSEFWKKVNIKIHMTEYDYFLVYIKESMVTSYWMEGTEVKSLDIKPEWEAQLKDFCEKMKIPYQEPKWRLGATYD